MIQLGEDVGTIQRKSGHELVLTLAESFPAFGDIHDVLSLAHFDHHGVVKHHVVIHLGEIDRLIHLLHRGRAMISYKMLEAEPQS
jgi:hypothetical protein